MELKKGNTCKYLENKEELANATVNEKSSDVEKNIFNDFGIKCFFARSDISLYSIFGGDAGSANLLAIFGSPISRKQYETNIEYLRRGLEDIKAKANDFRLDETIFVAWDVFDSLGWYAHSTLDKRKDIATSFISLGDMNRCLNGKEDKDEYVRHIVRHEIGHNLSTDTVLAAFRVMRHGLEGNKKEEFEKAILGLRNKNARRDEEETIAEIFSTYTDPNYKRGKLPRAFENLAEAMLGNNRNFRGITMDKGISDRDLLNINQIYLWRGETTEEYPEGKIAWYDPKKKKYVVFKSGAELLRYTLPIYQIKNEDVEKIIKALPNKEWNSWDVSSIVNSWLYLQKSIDEIIEEARKNGLLSQ